MLPGMIDTHQHLFAYARDRLKLNLKGAKSFEQLLELIRWRAGETPDGQWILGTGFDHEKFTDRKALPTKEDLDRVCPNNPLIITRYCLHVNVANFLALKAGRIGPGFCPKVAGTVEFRPDGQPTGTLRDAAAADVIARIPDPLATQEGRKDAVEAACHELNSFGLTGVHAIQGLHCNLPEFTSVYQDLSDEGRLTARVFLGFDRRPGCSIRTGLGDGMVKYGFYKLYVAGNMGGRTALLTQPYEDDPSTCGIPNYTQEKLDAPVKLAYDLHIQVGITIPEMKKEGYEPAYATALAAASGTIGVIIPPQHPLCHLRSRGTVLHLRPVHCRYYPRYYDRHRADGCQLLHCEEKPLRNQEKVFREEPL